MPRIAFSRRRFLQGSAGAAGLAAALSPLARPALALADRPLITHGVQTGDIGLDRAVHYTAAHYYDPDKAQFQDFAPFWEFVSGPLNAGTFGPNKLDATFRPQLMYVKAPPEGQVNLPPSAGLQFFGEVFIEGASGQMTVTLKDLTGADLWSTTLTPKA